MKKTLDCSLVAMIAGVVCLVWITFPTNAYAQCTVDEKMKYLEENRLDLLKEKCKEAGIDLEEEEIEAGRAREEAIEESKRREEEKAREEEERRLEAQRDREEEIRRSTERELEREREDARRRLERERAEERRREEAANRGPEYGKPKWPLWWGLIFSLAGNSMASEGATEAEEAMEAVKTAKNTTEYTKEKEKFEAGMEKGQVGNALVGLGVILWLYYPMQDEVLLSIRGNDITSMVAFHPIEDGVSMRMGLRW